MPLCTLGLDLCLEYSTFYWKGRWSKLGLNQHTMLSRNSKSNSIQDDLKNASLLNSQHAYGLTCDSFYFSSLSFWALKASFYLITRLYPLLVGDCLIIIIIIIVVIIIIHHHPSSIIHNPCFCSCSCCYYCCCWSSIIHPSKKQNKKTIQLGAPGWALSA